MSGMPVRQFHSAPDGLKQYFVLATVFVFVFHRDLADFSIRIKCMISYLFVVSLLALLL